MIGVPWFGSAVIRSVPGVPAHLLAAFLDIGQNDQSAVVGRADGAFLPQGASLGLFGGRGLFDLPTDAAIFFVPEDDAVRCSNWLARGNKI